MIVDAYLVGSHIVQHVEAHHLVVRLEHRASPRRRVRRAHVPRAYLRVRELCQLPEARVVRVAQHGPRRDGRVRDVCAAGTAVSRRHTAKIGRVCSPTCIGRIIHEFRGVRTPLSMCAVSQLLQQPSVSSCSVLISFTSCHSTSGRWMAWESRGMSKTSPKGTSRSVSPMWLGAKGGRMGTR